MTDTLLLDFLRETPIDRIVISDNTEVGRRVVMTNAVKPISPVEVVGERLRSIPDAVFEAFNELIVENFTGYDAIIKQKDVIARIKKKGISPAEVYKKGWLDVEDVYRKQGWKVEYDKPGYNEFYDAYFEFSKKSRGE